MTLLKSTIHRETAKFIQHRAVILSIAACGSQSEAMIGLRLKGCQKQYVITLSEVFQMAALRHGQREAQAKREARKSGVKWATAKRQFYAANKL